MEANKSTVINDFFSQRNTQFSIPVYQRNYDWKTEQCKALLDDIIRVEEQSRSGIDSEHFIGSIVASKENTVASSQTQQVTLIDGQQRITTLTLLLLAIYRKSQEYSDANLEDIIYNDIFSNRNINNERKLKLKVTANNSAALEAIYENKEDSITYNSNVINNFKFFYNQITPENLNSIWEGLHRLRMVEIVLHPPQDDAQKIFESMNSTGLDLGQADLIRNYVLMNLPVEKQNELFNKYWSEIEQNTKDENHTNMIDYLFRDYLIFNEKKFVSNPRIYTTFKKLYPLNAHEKIEKTLETINRLSKSYSKLINPENEQDIEIKKELQYIKDLELTTANVVLMFVLDDYANREITKQTLIEVLQLIQTLVFRRFIVGAGTNALNKIFATLYLPVVNDKSDYIKKITKTLLSKTGSSRFPDDKELIKVLPDKDFYNIRNKNKSYLFEKLEHFGQSEMMDLSNLTIEHIFPQNHSKWKKVLSNEEIQKMEPLTHTLGNLTLTAVNSKLGNKIFIEKQDIGFIESRIWLNQNVKEHNVWDSHTIEDRTKVLADRILNIWPFPHEVKEELNNEKQTNFVVLSDDPDFRNTKVDKIEIDELEIDLEETAHVLYYLELLRFFEKQNSELFNNKEVSEIIKRSIIESELRNPSQYKDYYVEVHGKSNVKWDKVRKLLDLYGIDADTVKIYLV